MRLEKLKTCLVCGELLKGKILDIIFGESISGIKGFYSTVKLSTDLTTDAGGEKTLFSVESVYTMNNGY